LLEEPLSPFSSSLAFNGLRHRFFAVCAAMTRHLSLQESIPRGLRGF